MAEFRAHWRISEATIRSLVVTVAELDGVPVAFSGVTRLKEDTLLIDFLFVLPDAQGRGLGELLLTRAEDRARQEDLSRLCLESDPHAAPFYNKHGFRTVATRPSEMSPGRDIPLMEKTLPPSVHKVSFLDIGISSAPWTFENTHERDILAHFEQAKKRIALLWNGRTLKLTGYRFDDGSFKGTCTECSFASYLAWRDWGAPDTSAFNLFGSAILRAADGALIFGVMSDRTATGGLIYPPGGNLDPTDLLADGKVDVIGAIYRELEEETGLTRAEVTPKDLLVTFDGPRISIGQVLDVATPAEELRDSILRFSAESQEQELADVRIVRTHADLKDPAIISYARAIGHYLLP